MRGSASRSSSGFWQGDALQHSDISGALDGYQNRRVTMCPLRDGNLAKVDMNSSERYTGDRGFTTSVLQQAVFKTRQTTAGDGPSLSMDHIM